MVMKVEEEVKEEVQMKRDKKVMMSQSLTKFIEADNKAYEEERKVQKDQKQFNKDFYKELAKTIAQTQFKQDESYMK